MKFKLGDKVRLKTDGSTLDYNSDFLNDVKANSIGTIKDISISGFTVVGDFPSGRTYWRCIENELRLVNPLPKNNVLDRTGGNV